MLKLRLTTLPNAYAVEISDGRTSRWRATLQYLLTVAVRYGLVRTV